MGSEESSLSVLIKISLSPLNLYCRQSHGMLLIRTNFLLLIPPLPKKENAFNNCDRQLNSRYPLLKIRSQILKGASKRQQRYFTSKRHFFCIFRCKSRLWFSTQETRAITVRHSVQTVISAL